MPRQSLRSTFLGLCLAAGAGLGLPLTLAVLNVAVPPLQAAPGAATNSSAMSEAQARAAATRILEAIQRKDANARYSQFAPSLQRVSSPEMVATTLRTQPTLLRWTITQVVPGLDSNMVEATLVTSAGTRHLVMVLDGQGRLEGYNVDRSDQKAEQVVRDFLTALTSGHFISASSFLSPRLQEEIPQSELQNKWQNLQKLAGQYQSVVRISPSESTTQERLVIATVKFNRITDNLFVVLDPANRIINVDFPAEPALPEQKR